MCVRDANGDFVASAPERNAALIVAAVNACDPVIRVDVAGGDAIERWARALDARGLDAVYVVPPPVPPTLDDMVPPTRRACPPFGHPGARGPSGAPGPLGADPAAPAASQNALLEEMLPPTMRTCHAPDRHRADCICGTL